MDLGKLPSSQRVRTTVQTVYIQCIPFIVFEYKRFEKSHSLLASKSESVLCVFTSAYTMSEALVLAHPTTSSFSILDNENLSKLTLSNEGISLGLHCTILDAHKFLVKAKACNRA